MPSTRTAIPSSRSPRSSSRSARPSENRGVEMKKTYLAAVAAFLLSPAAFAQGALTPAKIAVIDQQRVFTESAMGKTYVGQLTAMQKDMKAEYDKRQAEVQRMDAALKALQDD